MTKQQKQTAFENIVKTNGVLKKVLEIEAELNAYSLSKTVVKNRYEVQISVENLMKTMEEFTLQLAHMADESVKWEVLE